MISKLSSSSRKSSAPASVTISNNSSSGLASFSMTSTSWPSAMSAFVRWYPTLPAPTTTMYTIYVSSSAPTTMSNSAFAPLTVGEIVVNPSCSYMRHRTGS